MIHCDVHRTCAATGIIKPWANDVVGLGLQLVHTLPRERERAAGLRDSQRNRRKSRDSDSARTVRIDAGSARAVNAVGLLDAVNPQLTHIGIVGVIQDQRDTAVRTLSLGHGEQTEGAVRAYRTGRSHP